MKGIQDFNYHTHTERCRHAEKGYSDEDYVKEAFETGITFLAFTDHIPFMNTKDPKTNVRMSYEEIDEYLQSIINLKEKYQSEINIETGFEFEYFSGELDHILRMKSMVDKMILGQHFVLDSQGNIKYFTSKEELTDEEVIQYICLIYKALQTGIPDIIAHPDLFLKYRKEFGKKEEFFTRQLCEIIQRYKVPVEINLNEIYREYLKAKIDKTVANDTELPYNLTLYIGINKDVDTVVQKAVELGVKRIVPFISQHGNIDSVNPDRLNTIVLESSKQCGRATLATVEDVVYFADIGRSNETIYAFYEFERNNRVKDAPIASGDIGVVIGCEGGFSEEEYILMKQKGFHVLTLGKRILRVSTAVVSALTLINERMGEV